MTIVEKQIQSYFGIEDRALSQIADLFKGEELAKGDYHTKAESYSTSLSILTEGYIRIYTYHKGKEITQWISSPGQFVTDLSNLLFNGPTRWNIQALTDCKIHSMSKTDYHNIDQQVSDWPRLEKMFIAKCFTTLEDRVFSFLSMTAEERFQMLFHYNSDLFNQVPLQYLASMLGMTPETLSRIRKKTS